MRRTLAVATSLAALVAWLAPAVQGRALTDPACDPWDNRFSIQRADVDTENDLAFATSGVTYTALACGTAIDGGAKQKGAETLFDHFDVTLAPGVEVNDTANVLPGSHVGKARVNVATYIYFMEWLPIVFEDEEMWFRIRDRSECESENEITVGGPVAGAVISCYLGTTSDGLGHSYGWVTRAGSGLTFTLGPFHNDAWQYPAGITRIGELSICGIGGTLITPECGTADESWLQKNGAPSRLGCQSSNGMYSVTATNKAGQTTAAAGSCVRWRIGIKRAPTAPGSTRQLAFDRPSLHYRGPDPG